MYKKPITFVSNNKIIDMKLFVEPEPPYLMRINIKKQGVKTEFITICECEQQECYDYIKKLIEAQFLSPFQSG